MGNDSLTDICVGTSERFHTVYTKKRKKKKNVFKLKAFEITMSIQYIS